jgi:hypothetical protein
MTAGRILIAQAIVVGALGLLALDIYAHARVQSVGGVNVWGYRGPVARSRQDAEIRIAIVGGTRAFGWGQTPDALGGEVRRLTMLSTDRPGAALRPVVVLNLARLGALADEYPAIVERYRKLAPDAICVYDDLGVRGAEPRPRSAVFDVTGYAPALPLVLDEKGRRWRGHGGWIRGGVLEAGAAVLRRTDGALSRLTSRSSARTVLDDGAYVSAMTDAIAASKAHAMSVVLVLSPIESPLQSRNHDALAVALRPLARERWLRIVDLNDVPSLRDPRLRVDGWNYSAAGLAVVADRISAALLTVIGGRA